MRTYGVTDFLEWAENSGGAITCESGNFKRAGADLTETGLRVLLVEWLEYISKNSPRGVLMYQPDDTDVTTQLDALKKHFQKN